MTMTFPDNIPCGYFSFTDARILSDINQLACTLTGYTKEELAGRSVDSIFTLSTKIFFQTHFFPMLKLHGHAEEIFLTLRTKAGDDLPVLLNAKTSSGKEQEINCAFIHVPHRKKFEDELVAARKAAEQALNDNEALNKVREELQLQAEKLERQLRIVNKQNYELIQRNYVATHNLKEPIRKILVYLEKLQTDTGPANRQINMIKLSKAALQMKTIITDLQQYVWIQEAVMQFEKTDLNELVRLAYTQVQEEYPDIPIELSLNDLPSIQGDMVQLSLLFYHLFTNAVKFRKGDRVKITVNGVLIKQNVFRNVENKYKYEDHIKIDIRDEGIGFDPAYKIAVFELFKRMHYNSGQGLGLALCKKVVDNHSGMIHAESKPGEYTIITVLLPVHPH